MKNNLLSVVFPVYNEEKIIDDFFHSAILELQKLNLDFEIIFVNDRSIDRSGEIIKSCAKNYPNVIIVEHNTNRGYGAALCSGFKAARGDLIFFCDCDGQFNLKDLSKLIANLEGVDFVAGYRIRRSDPFLRTVIAFLGNKLINLLFRIDVRDINCAFKLFRRKVLDTITLSSQGGFINAEILIKAKRYNFVFNQAGVNHYPRKSGKPTGANSPVILRTIKEFFDFISHKR